VSSGSVNVQPLNFFYYEVIDTGVRSATASVFGIDASVFTSPLANGVLIFVGAILAGTLLIVVAVRGGTKVRDAHLVFYLALAAAIVSVIVYASDGYRLSSALFSGEAFTAIVVGALLFFVTLPKVQSRVKNFFLVMLTMLSAIVLGVMYFAGGSGGTMATFGAHPQSGAEIISRVPLPAGISGNFQNVNLAPEFYVEVFWLMLATAVIYLVALPRVWAWVMTYLSFDQGVKALSYTGVFIVAFSIAIMAALFYAVNVPLWRFGVAVVAAIIGVRFLWRFLRNYRKIDTQGSELRNNDESESARDMIGAGR
jgi:hypothetical protein